MRVTSPPHAALPRVPPALWFVGSACAAYGGAAVAVHLFDAIAPVGVAWLRTVFAGAILVAGASRDLHAWRKATTFAQLRTLALFGTVLVGMNMCFYRSIDSVPMGTAVAIEFIGPISVAAWGTRTKRNALALLLAAAGAVLLANVEFAGRWQGLLWAIAAGTFWAAFIVVGSRVAQFGHTSVNLGVASLLGTLTTAPLGLPLSLPAFTNGHLLALAAVVGLLSSVIPYLVQQHLLRHISASHFALLLCILPATAALVGALTLMQIPTAVEVLGIAMVVLAVSLRTPSRPRPAAP